jgi:hypothetical protein
MDKRATKSLNKSKSITKGHENSAAQGGFALQPSSLDGTGISLREIADRMMR